MEPVMTRIRIDNGGEDDATTMAVVDPQIRSR
jgi:hypothetical protein